MYICSLISAIVELVLGPINSFAMDAGLENLSSGIEALIAGLQAAVDCAPMMV